MDFRIDTDTWFIFTLLFIGTLAMFIFLFVIIPFFTRRKQLKRINNRQKRKQDNYNMFLEKHTNRKISDLQYINEKLLTNLKNDLHEIMQSGGTNQKLIPFFSNFEKLYPNFSQSLQKFVPGITQNEIKLCALLRLNLSAKEISRLLNITPESVNKSRYRLRKKIGLDSKQDLFVFLSNI